MRCQGEAPQALVREKATDQVKVVSSLLCDVRQVFRHTQTSVSSSLRWI